MHNLFLFLYFLIFIIPIHCNAMEECPWDSIYEWILISDEADIHQTVDTMVPAEKLEKQNTEALVWSIKNGGPPEIITMLAPPELVEKFLQTARSNFVKKNGKKYALETAILQNNIDFIKAVFDQTDSLKFKATAFALAMLHRKKEVALFISKNVPSLITPETFPIIKEYFLEAIKQKSSRSLKIMFESNLEISSFYSQLLIEYGFEKSKTYAFPKGMFYLQLKRQSFEEKNPNFMIKTL